MLFSWLGIVMAGLLGTLAMTLWMYIGHAYGVERHNPGFFLGTLVFGVSRAAFAAGLVIHFLIGMIAAGIYAAVMSALGIPGGVLWGLLFGAAHWLVVMLLYGLVGYLHPAVKRGQIQAPGLFALREGWTEPAMSFIDHLLFGAIVGGTLAVYRIGVGLVFPWSMDSWQQPVAAPSVAWLLLVLLAVVFFIVIATVTTQLGAQDEVFLSALPEEIDRKWMISELRKKYQAGLLSQEEFEQRLSELK